MASGHTKLHSDEHLSGGVDEISGFDATQIASGVVTNTEFERLDGISNPIATEDYVDDKIQGLDWNESVLSRYDPNGGLPGSPSEGDRYISTGTANGWNKDAIYEYIDGSWVETLPDEGFATWVEDENVQYLYNDDYDAGEWITLSSTTNHGSLTGLDNDDHKQYLLVDGTRAMSGSLDMGTFNITNVGNVDGIDVSSHDHDGDAPTVPNTGLTNSSLTVAGNTIALGGSSAVDHTDLSNITEDQHHNAFVGLVDNAGTSVVPDASNEIQLTDDGIVNADAGTNSISLSVTEGNISHDNISGITYNNHHGVGNAIKWDSSNNIAVTSNGIGTNEIDESLSPTWTGTHDFSGATLLPPQFSQDAEPTISNNSAAVWRDTNDNTTWLLIDVGGTQYKVEATT